MNCIPWSSLGACLAALVPVLPWPAQSAFAEDAGRPDDVAVVDRASGKVALKGPTVLYSVAEGLFFDTVHNAHAPADRTAADFDVCTAVGVIRIEGRNIHVRNNGRVSTFRSVWRTALHRRILALRSSSVSAFFTLQAS